MYTEVSQVRPTSLNHLVGNRAVVNQVRVAIDAAQQDSHRMVHAAMLGGPGLGKSLLASVIADELASSFIQILGQNLQRPADLSALLLKATSRCVVHIDEAHELPKQIQTALYMALDQRVLKLPGGEGVQNLPLEDFTLLLSTTDEYALLPPLVSRMKLLLHFEFYSEADLERIVETRAKALHWEMDSTVLPGIASRSRSIARRALNILESSRRICRAEGESLITLEHLEKACRIDGIDAGGLERRDRQYLRLLVDRPKKVNVLASSLGIPMKTLNTHIEPPLIRLGWLTKDEQGRRCITERTRTHLKEVGDE